MEIITVECIKSKNCVNLKLKSNLMFDMYSSIIEIPNWIVMLMFRKILTWKQLTFSIAMAFKRWKVVADNEMVLRGIVVSPVNIQKYKKRNNI